MWFSASSGNRCIHGNNCRRNPARGRKVRVLKEQLRFWKKKRSQVVCMKFKFGKEKGHLEALSKMVNLMSEILARRSLRKEHLTRPHDKKSTPAKQRGIWREKYISSRPRTKLRSPKKQKNVCNGHLAEVQKPNNGVNRKWSSANKRGGTSVCSRSRSVRHSEHGCSYEWENGETTRLTKNGKTITWKMDNVVPLVAPCHHLLAAARLLHQDQKITQNLLVNPKHQHIQWRLDVSSMHAGNRCRQTLICKPREAVV